MFCRSIYCMRICIHFAFKFFMKSFNTHSILGFHVSSYMFHDRVRTQVEAVYSDSNVPASDQKPLTSLHVMVRSVMYTLFTSVISNSPRAEGLSFFIISKTRLS